MPFPLQEREVFFVNKEIAEIAGADQAISLSLNF